MKGALCPKNHRGFEHARAKDDQWRPIVADRRLTRRNPILTRIRPNIPCGVGTPIDKASRPSLGTAERQKL